MAGPPKKETTQKAVALRYEMEREKAPRVVAKGRGKIAEKIVALAEVNRIPLYEDANLVEVLEAMELTQEIPPELYRAVAEVLAFIYRINKKP